MNQLHWVVILTLGILGVGCQSLFKNSGSYKGFGAGSVSAKHLAEFAPPPIDPQLARKIESRLDLRSPGYGSLSHDLKNLFFSWSVTGTSQVWSMTKNTFPVQLTGGQDSTRIVAEISELNLLIVSRDKDGQENPGLYFIDLVSGALSPLYVKDRVQVFGYGLDDQRKNFYFGANDEFPDRYTFYKINLQTKKIDKFMEAREGFWRISDISGNRFLLANMRGSDAIEYWLWDSSKGEMFPLLGQNEKVRYGVRFAAESGSYLVSSDHLTEFRALYLYSKGQWKPLIERPGVEVEDFSLSRNRQFLAVNLSEKGTSNTEIYSLPNWKRVQVKVPPTKNRIQATSGFYDDGNGFILSYVEESVTQPHLAYKINLLTGNVQKWVTPSVPEIVTDGFLRPTLETYLAEDKTQIPMFVYASEKCRKLVNCPVLVNFHGGPEGQSTPSFSATRELYSEMDYVVAYPNVRGSVGYGKSWLDSDNGAKRLKVITDIRDAGLHFKNNWKISGQPDRHIVVMGGSYGGYSTFYAMTAFAGVYSGGIAIVGMSDLLSFLNNTAPYRRALRVSEYGDPEKDKEALIQLSPVTHLEKLNAPLLIIQGAEDPRVPAGEAIQFYRKMQERGIKSGKLVLFPDEGHGIQKRGNQVKYQAYVLEFLKQWELKP